MKRYVNPAKTEAEYGNIKRKMTTAPAIFIPFEPYRVAKNSGVVDAFSRRVIERVRRPRTSQATNPPKTAFATPTQSALYELTQPYCPANPMKTTALKYAAP